MPSPPPTHLILASQTYLLAWCVIAVIAGIGAVGDYEGGPASTSVFAWIGSIMGCMLFAGIALEIADYKSAIPALSAVLQWLRFKRFGEIGTHIAINLLSICSVGIAAVNMHTENWDWQFGLSCALMVMVFFYNVLYTPCVMVSYAAFPGADDATQKALTLQFRAASYIWKASQVEELLGISSAA